MEIPRRFRGRQRDRSGSRHLAALADAEPTPYWLDPVALDGSLPDVAPALVNPVRADVAVVGGGYAGLWTALRAVERNPNLDVVVLEANRVGHGASGRNGGFCAASLTHGLLNGVARFPEELTTLERLGQQNLDGIAATLDRYGIEADFERTGDLTVAVKPWQQADLRDLVEVAEQHGRRLEYLDTEAVRARVASPTYLAGAWDADGVAMVHPTKLAFGLRAACQQRGVRFFERTPVTALDADGAGVRLSTPYGAVHAAKVVLATNAFPPLLRRLRPFTVPVYDYSLVTEPLSAGQRSQIGWQDRCGVTDAGNRFHYYRLTADNRILWGGYDAIYYFGGAVRTEREQRPETFALLADHFFTTFPQLEGIGFTHAWGGVIDTCTRFCAFYGTALDDRVGYALGYTGLGLGSTRFAADVVLDLLAGERTERTALSMVQSRPVPFPPEPVRWAGIQLTRASLAQADARGGRRNLWLRTLDRLGLGFDS